MMSSRLQQAARTELAAGHVASAGSITRTPSSLELRDIALRRGVEPHPDVHRRSDDHRLVGREKQGGCKVVGNAGGHLREEVGGRGADQHEVRRAAKLDVADLHLVLQFPEGRVDLAFGKRAEGSSR